MQLLNVVLGVLGAQRLQRNQLKKRPLQAACYLVASCKLLGCKVVVINLKKATASFLSWTERAWPSDALDAHTYHLVFRNIVVGNFGN